MKEDGVWEYKTYREGDILPEADLKLTVLALNNGVLNRVQGLSNTNKAVVVIAEGDRVNLGEGALLLHASVHVATDTAVGSIGADNESARVGGIVLAKDRGIL